MWPFSSVFLSYSHQDAAYVARLAEHLERAGLQVWRDTEHLDYGDRWEDVVRDQVDNCSAMIVVMSPASEASPHVGNELQRARDLGKPILPVLLAGEGFFALGTIHHFDARRGDLPDERFLAVLRGIPAGPATGQLVVGDPPAQAVAWQNRPRLLDDLVRGAAAGTTVVCALAGQRGVGKTQLAAAYARLRIQHGWPVVVWTVAETEASLMTTLDELAVAARIRERDMDTADAARAALRWLRSHPGPCLLIYDNAVDADLIQAWTPPIGSVHTVVTTTHREFDALGTLVDISLFTADQAADYLRRRTGDEDLTGASELAESLGRLPLALAQAGAIVGRGRRYPDYRGYLAALRDTPTARLLPRTPGTPYPVGTAEAILLSLDDLGAADTNGRARQLLERLAVLSPAGVDRVLLQRLSGARQGDPALDELVAMLANRSLAAAVERVVVHRLIQRVVREHRHQAGMLTATLLEAAAGLMAAALQISENWRDRALMSEYAEHARVLLENAVDDDSRGALLTALSPLASHLREAHSYTAAIATCRLMIDDSDRLNGPDDQLTLTLRSHLAESYRLAGRIDEAISLHIGALADRERVLGAEHPDTLVSRTGLANLYRMAGRFPEAIEMHTRALADYESTLGPEHPYSLISRNNLAVAYRLSGQIGKAADMLAQIVAEAERIHGNDHPSTLASRYNLAAAYRTAGRSDEAIELLTRNLTDCERVLGPEHPNTSLVRTGLADALRARSEGGT